MPDKPLLKPSKAVVDLSIKIVEQLFMDILNQKRENVDKQELISWQDVTLVNEPAWYKNNQNKILAACQEIINKNDECIECSGTGVTEKGFTRVCNKCEGSGHWLR